MIEPRPPSDTHNRLMELARYRASESGQTTAAKVDVLHLTATKLENSRDLYAAASANGRLRRSIQNDPPLARRLATYREEMFSSAKDQAGMKLLDWVRDGEKGLNARGLADAVNERVAEYGSKFNSPETGSQNELAMKAKLLTAIKDQGERKAASAAHHRGETIQLGKLAGGFATVEALTQLSRLLVRLPNEGNTAFLHAVGADDEHFARRYIGGFSGGAMGLTSLGTFATARNWRNAALSARTFHGAHEILSTETPTEV